jgi:hypothetical protein
MPSTSSMWHYELRLFLLGERLASLRRDAENLVRKYEHGNKSMSRSEYFARLAGIKSQTSILTTEMNFYLKFGSRFDYAAFHHGFLEVLSRMDHTQARKFCEEVDEEYRKTSKKFVSTLEESSSW